MYITIILLPNNVDLKYKCMYDFLKKVVEYYALLSTHSIAFFVYL